MEKGGLVRLTADDGRDPEEFGAAHLHLGLDGFIDAGAAGEQITSHLLTGRDGVEVARFDTDALIDYRSRRPAMTFSRDHWSEFSRPQIVLTKVTDAAGTPFLVLHGLEPDFRWEAFADAVLQLCRTYGVSSVSSAHGIPMAVPHTRPIGVTRYAGDPSSLPPTDEVFGEVEVPGSVEALLHLRLSDAGLDTFGVAVHVPHYLANTPFGDAAVAGMESLTARTGWDIPLEDMRSAAELNRTEIATEVEGSDEVQQVVQGLERSYDQFIEGRRRRSLLAAEAEDLPSADEIGAEFEQFLRSHADDDELAEDDESEGDPR